MKQYCQELWYMIVRLESRVVLVYYTGCQDQTKKGHLNLFLLFKIYWSPQDQIYHNNLVKLIKKIKNHYSKTNLAYQLI